MFLILAKSEEKRQDTRFSLPTVSQFFLCSTKRVAGKLFFNGTKSSFSIIYYNKNNRLDNVFKTT